MLVGLAEVAWLLTWLLIALALVGGVLAALWGWAREQHARSHDEVT